ncbi:pectin acetylesterase-family hydrolase [Polyangium fumosum]|uniref:Pectinacetylesterase n=1 Tax=Polyangium fumosum TaxID=889272 RepID=A0A4U1IU09_9BACT|nr:pectin acetylesterase-family hydrolase [Polyangium fumosum]TKC97882.1 hypothetical protein E8A74_43615 [Polyangium fumosum]
MNRPRAGSFAPVLFFLAAASTACLVGCGDDVVSAPPVEEPRVYGEWLKVEVPGTVCGNGSQYKFFVNWSETSNDLAVMFEGGGACWDYDSCTGKTGIRGAANPNGIDDDHMVIMQHVFPLLRRDEGNPARDWNLVYFPYCTGDIHSGNRVTDYVGAPGEGAVEFHHSGHPNNLLVTDWLAKQFEHIPRLLVSGCSAGGAGSLANYYFLRKGLPVGRGYMLDDSGPIFPSAGPSKYLHETIREAWDVDSVYQDLPVAIEPGDLGSINTALADAFPDDRLGITFFQRDMDYSLYSYERFYPGLEKEEILALWAEDTKLLTAQFDTRENLAYFIPYWRERNNSHCGTVFDYVGTEIQEAGVDLGDFVDVLLDDGRPLESYIESVQPNEDVGP